MIVYKITNTINNKCYIGQTIYGLDRRIKQHFGKNSPSTKLKLAIDEHGKENFVYDVLEKAKSREELNELEIKYIKK